MHLSNTERWFIYEAFRSLHPFSDETFEAYYLFGENTAKEKTTDEYYQCLQKAILEMGKVGSTKRYDFSFQPKNAIEEVCEAYFNVAFKKRPENLIAAAELIEKSQFYSPWKKVFVIDLPNIGVEILSSPHVKFALKVVVFLAAHLFFSVLYRFSDAVFHSKVIPIVSSIAAHLPTQEALPIAKYVAYYAIVFFDSIEKINSRLPILECIPAIVFIFDQNPAILRDMPAEVRLAMLASMEGLLLFAQIWNRFLRDSAQLIIDRRAFFIAYMFNEDPGRVLKSYVEINKKHRLNICKEKAHTLWINLVRKTEIDQTKVPPKEEFV